MLSVLAITNMYPPHHYGGYELSCRDVMERMRSRGDRITVLTTVMRRPGVEDPPAERDGVNGIAVHRDLHWWWDDHVLTNPALPMRALHEVQSQAALRRALRTSRPDVISIWNMGAMSLGLLTTIERTGIPVVFNVCDDWMLYGPRLDAWGRLFRGSLLRRSAGRLLTTVARLPSRVPDRAWPGAYVFVSEATRAAARAGTGWELAISGVVGSGIDPVDFPVPSGPVVDRSWQWRLLYVGRVEHRKGVEPLVRALALLPEQATLDIVGPPEPAYMPFLTALVNELGLGARVRFSEVPRNQLRSIYAGADVFVFPSLWAEPFGLVPIEAMACDTPVLASGTGGSVEFLRDGANCLIAHPGEPAAMAYAVRRLAGEPDLRRRLVEGGRTTAAWANVNDLTQTVAAWHDHAAAGFSGAPPPDRRPPRA